MLRRDAEISVAKGFSILLSPPCSPFPAALHMHDPGSSGAPFRRDKACAVALCEMRWPGGKGDVRRELEVQYLPEETGDWIWTAVRDG
jgi:hypothetical protein